MNDGQDDLIRGQLPELAAGGLDDEQTARLKALLATDADLRAEFELIQSLRRERPEPPAYLAQRIQAGLSEPLVGHGRPRWHLPAAAMIVLSLGAGWLWNSRSPGREGPGEVDEPIASIFPADDGLVAGAMILGDLTDAELEALLEEMEA